MRPVSAPAHPRAWFLTAWLGPLSWLVVLGGAVVGLRSTGFGLDAVPGPLSLVVLLVFFGLLLVRLALLVALESRRRTARLVLAGALVLWATGSAALNAGPGITEVPFPSLGEVVFIGAYVLLAAHLSFDLDPAGGPRPGVRPLTAWLDSLVALGGASCLAAFVLLSPLQAAFADDGLRLLMALLYPLVDGILLVVVLAQVVLRRRRLGPHTAVLATGLLGLAAMDFAQVSNLTSATYASNAFLSIGYGIAFALIVAAACARPTLAGWVPDGARASRGIVLAAAAITALAVLAVRPVGMGHWYVTAPAVLTLLAACVRLILALREAQGAAEARRLSLTDDLTGLPNRRAVLGVDEDSPGWGSQMALLLLDLDGFKEINDTLGHEAGDAVLAAVARRLEAGLGPGEVVARLGGDEFAVLVPEADPLALLQIAAEVQARLLETIEVDRLDLRIRASIGIAIRERPDVTVTDLLRRADVAMYEAKSTRAGALLYDPSQDGFSRERLQLMEDLRRAVTDEQLEVWYQPQIDAATQRVTAVEALVRWRHPERGLLMPVAFLPDARRSGLMLALTHEVVSLVVADARRWADAGLVFRTALNCAPPELLGGSVLPRLFEAITAAGLPSHSILVEVTEDSFVTDPELARETLLQLKERGVEVSIDDYGTGFSSLAYLRDLPVQELKMDRSFVATITTDARSRVIVDSTRQLAHAMGLRLVAEGVEDAATAAELVAMGVDVLQGYHIARPMPSTAVAGWVTAWTASLDAEAAPLRLGRDVS